MSKDIFYKYNPDTDNFERYYPSLSRRLWKALKICFLGLAGAFLFILVFNYAVMSPREESLKNENKKLKSEYGVLSAQLDNMHDVMDRIIERDDNFYRVMMQMEPVSATQRFSGYNENKKLSKMTDLELVTQLTKRINLLESKMVSQLQSLEQLQQTLANHQDRLSHVPSVLPINIADYTMSSGYGHRVDPIYGTSKFHEGLDFAASEGTNVFATGDGKVKVADRQGGYGNCIDIDHGYNYLTRYAHLSEILVKPGEDVKRGQLIGKVGTTGKSTGPHLHYEVRFKNEPQNPVNYYYMDLSPEEYYEMIRIAENAGHVMD